MERQLVVRAQAGDLDAFDQLAHQLTDRLYAVAYRILRNGPSAEDATQQAMVSIWRQLPKLRDPDRFDAWSFRLLVNGSERKRLPILLVRQTEGSEPDGATATPQDG